MNESYGFVYVLSNPSMPGHIKIGRTRRRPEQRMAELSSATGVPTEFELVYSRAFENAAMAEGLVHALLEEQGLRVSQNREFFQMSAQAAVDAVDSIAQKLGREAEMLEDAARLVRKAESLLSSDSPSVAQLEQSLSLLEFAAEAGDVAALYHAAGVAQTLASRRKGDAAQAHLAYALALYGKAAQEGIVRSQVQMALLMLAKGDLKAFSVHWRAYFDEMPADELPPQELDYLLQVLHDQLMPAKKLPRPGTELRPYRNALRRAARQQYPGDVKFHTWLLPRLYSSPELLLERYKLQLLGLAGLGLLYLADPALFFTLATGGAIVLVAWRVFLRPRLFGRKKPEKS